MQPGPAAVALTLRPCETLTMAPEDSNDAAGDDQPQVPGDLAGLFEQLGGPELFAQLRRAMAATGGAPVNWDLARQGALHLAASGDRPPTPDEVAGAAEALRLAEHWLDDGSLPAPPDAGRLAVVSRQTWVNAAVDGLRPLVEPVAQAQIAALADLVEDQAPMEALGVELGGLDLGAVLGDLRRMLEPMGAVLMGMQAGQVIGQLARQLLGQFDLAIPTADTATTYRIAVNAAEAFTGYDLDATEVSVVLALHEAAHRRQFHAVPWLAGHVHRLVATFAAGTEIDAERLMDLSREVMAGVDPDDPEALQQAMERASQFRLEPTAAQRRVLERLQGVVSLLQAWTRAEVRAAATPRLPNLGRVEEVLRRRRATAGEGERLLEQLLGLDLRPRDEAIGDRFVAAVVDARGPEGLRRALAHPENLPDADELADPPRWLARMAGGEEVPDDPSTLFGPGDAPPEPPDPEDGGDRGGPSADG